MEWILLRHPDAVPGENDISREISVEGWRQIETLAPRLPDFDLVLVSPARRTFDAGEYLSEGHVEVFSVPELYDAGEDEAAIMALYERIGEEPFLDYLNDDAGTLLRYGRRAKDAIGRALRGPGRERPLVIGHHPLLQALALVIVKEQRSAIAWQMLSVDAITKERLGKAEGIRIAGGSASRL